MKDTFTLETMLTTLSQDTRKGNLKNGYSIIFNIHLIGEGVNLFVYWKRQLYVHEV